MLKSFAKIIITFTMFFLSLNSIAEPRYLNLDKIDRIVQQDQNITHIKLKQQGTIITSCINGNWLVLPYNERQDEKFVLAIQASALGSNVLIQIDEPEGCYYPDIRRIEVRY